MEEQLISKISKELSGYNIVQVLTIVGFFEENMIPLKYISNINGDNWERLKNIILQKEGTPTPVIDEMIVDLVYEIMEE